MSDFVPGLYVKAPHEKAPDYVKAKGSIKVKDLGNFLREANKRGDEWVNFEVKENKSGDRWSVFVDDWKPNGEAAQPVSNTDDFGDDLPF